VSEVGLTYLHVFPYSPRPGTPAARMPQVASDVRKDRAARLRRVGEAAVAAFLEDRVGTFQRALVERELVGHTDHFAPLRVIGADLAPGTVATFHIEGVEGGMLVGRPA
jgi:threonylcarbamoyladenosine tRNA methylthiotransferase MtaB